MRPAPVELARRLHFWEQQVVKRHAHFEQVRENQSKKNPQVLEPKTCGTLT